jgi:hypothetical protein
MKTWLKLIRGAVGMGLTWAGLWSAVGALVAVSTRPNLPGLPTRLDWIFGFAAQFAVLGFVGGIGFSTVLGVIEGRRRFDQMSLARFAAWGALGGLAIWAARGTIGYSVMGFLNAVGVPALNWSYGLSGGIIVMLGAGCSAGSLLLARRVDDREFLESGERVAGVGLTAREVARCARR